MFKKVNVSLTAMMLLPALGLVACGEEPAATSGGIPLPEGISLRELPSGATAIARIDALDREIPLVISNDQASGGFDDLPEGAYTVSIKFKSAGSGIVLAESQQEVVYGGALQQLSFSKTAYTYPDNDGDNYSNLNEILVENDPNNGDDTPIPKRVFITSVSGQGDLSEWDDADGGSGLAAADNVCQARADAAGLSGTYRAWLSDNDDDAYCRIANLSGQRGVSSCDTGELQLGPYIRTDGFPVAVDLEGLTGDGKMFSSIHFDEYGNDVSADFLLTWTGSDYLGRYYKTNGSCNAWTSTGLEDRGGYGVGNGTSFQWTEAWKEACGGGSAGRLYCFQTSDADAVLPIYKQDDAKTVFVTSVKGSGDLSSWSDSGDARGREAGNAICRSLASSEGHENAETYTAWLSSSSSSAADSLAGNGPWARPDGVLVANSKSDVIKGILFTGIAQNEKGTYVGSAVWTGTKSNGECVDCNASSSCDDWTSSSSSFAGLHGISSYVNIGWTLGDWGETCADEKHLYCFEGD